MKSLRYLILLLLVSPLGAAVLRVTPWPLSLTAHERIEALAVHVESGEPCEAWSERVRETNPSLELEQEPVARVRVEVVGDEETEASLKQIAQRAQRESAWAGANLICLDQREAGSHGGYTAAVFTAYRVTYHSNLVLPNVLASAATVPVSGAAMVPTLTEGGESRWAAPKTARDTLALVRFLKSVESGREVRLELSGGKILRGTLIQVDEDGRVWVRPAGVAGFLHDRAIYPSDVQVAALPAILDEPWKVARAE